MLLPRFFEDCLVETFVCFVDHLVAFPALDPTRIMNHSPLFRVGQCETSRSYSPNWSREFPQILLGYGSPNHASTLTALLAVGFG
jgi:hypothetical protein